MSVLHVIGDKALPEKWKVRDWEEFAGRTINYELAGEEEQDDTAATAAVCR